jgi:hypothetical protein
MAIAGHTHRPLFESLSKFDNIRILMENLLRRYVDAGEGEKAGIEKQIRLYRSEMERLASERASRKKTQSLYGAGPFLIPCVFNSGSATGKHGLTALEIREGRIYLVYWTTGPDEHPYLESEKLAMDSIADTWYRYVIHTERLDSIFTRIRLLGCNAEGCPID